MGIMAPSQVLPGADRREAREASAMGRRIRRPLLGRDLVNPTGVRPPQTTRRGHRVAAQLLGAHRRPCWARSGGQVLVHLVGSSPNWGSQPENLLLHDGPMRPDLVDPPGLAGDMASGGPEAEHQQEIPVI